MPGQKKSVLARIASELFNLLLPLALIVIQSLSREFNFQEWFIGFMLICLIAMVIYDLATAKAKKETDGIIRFLPHVLIALFLIAYVWSLRGIPLLLGLLIWAALIAKVLMPFIKEGLIHLAASYKELSRKDRDEIHS